MALKPRFSKKLDQIGDETSDILNTSLTGFVVGSNTAITSSDTILSAFGKTQGQINALSTGLGDSVKRDGTSTLTATWNVGNQDITNINMLALGVTTATATVDVSGNHSSTAWTTNGIGLRWRAATYTDTTSSGTVSDVRINTFGIATIAASSVTTFTSAYGTVFDSPAAGTNVTITTSYSIRSIGNARFDSTIFATGGNLNFSGATRTIQTIDSNILQFGTNGTVRMSINNSAAAINIGSSTIATLPVLGLNVGTRQNSAWTTTGTGLVMAATTFTDATSSGTVAAQYINVFAAPTIAASSVTTYTLSATQFIAAPIAGTNVTQTNTAALVLGDHLYFQRGAATRFGTFDNQGLSLVTNQNARITVDANGFYTQSHTALGSGTIPFLQYTQANSTGGAQPFALWTAGTLTGQTASTEIIDQHFNNAATLTRATGAVALQRGTIITGRTYAFVGSSTITLASTFDVVQSIAGTNATITTNYAQRWIFDSSNYMGINISSGGLVSFTGVGSGPGFRFNNNIVVNARSFFGGITTPTAYVHLAAGAAAASSAPLKFTAGTNQTTAETGAMEYNGTNLFFIRTGTTRENIICSSAVNAISPTAPDRTITVNIDGTTYYIAAKTTND